MDFLFKNFLSDKRVYGLNERWYSRLFYKLLGEEPENYYQVSFRNGEKFYDGNPIFSVLVGNRSVRIIQDMPESSKPFLTTTFKSVPEENIDELVITLELSKEVKPVLTKLIKAWLQEGRDKDDLNKLLN
ncbi:MAG TPA: hypothetical protein PKA00_07670 [Saprospiraceae bacterium]|mgnify:CR=1 FL=1|nr:hypothetical protein [Saprospiraceae bacterium]HMQ82769.1 hypothetical protein [Saprospiraceae bacterium]